MLRHTGKRRTYQHNLRLATILCLTAGFVNAAGFIAFLVLTTNVTGHAALLGIKIAERDLPTAATAALWLLLFLAGAFSSSFYIAQTGRDKASSYTFPLFVEMFILLTVAYFGYANDGSGIMRDIFAGMLLFAMGMQNALVSLISGSVVRTTHLTGIFTDLGIDLSAALLNKKHNLLPIKKRIVLRLTIIFFFLAGGVIGSAAFNEWHYKAFYIPAAFVFAAIFYDYFRLGFLRFRLRLDQARQ